VNSSDESRVGHPLLGAGCLLAAAALFALNGSVSKSVLAATVTSLELVEIRCLLAAVVFAAVALWRDPSSLRIGRRELGFVAAYGIFGVAMVQWLYFVSIARMPVSITLLIEFTAPVLVALWVRFVRRDVVRGRIWAALALIVVGLALVARVWAGLTLDGVGLLAAGGAAVSLAAYYLLGEHGVGRRDPLSLAAWSFGVAGVFWCLVQPVWDLPVERMGAAVELGRTGLSAPAWVFVAFVVLLGTAAPFGLTLLGLREIGATRAGLLATAEPPLAGLVAWPLLDETLLRVQVAGAVVVLTGIVLAETARAPQPTSRSDSADRPVYGPLPH
jgi:drug/metabolite transporter (DMT)-like permease